MPGTDPYASRANKSYKAELDRFFESGVASSRIKTVMKDAAENAPASEPSESPERARLIRKVRAAETFDDFVGSVNELRAAHSLPADADILTRVLEHPDEDAVRDALRRLAEMTNRLALGDMRRIGARLKSLGEVARDDETIELVESLRAKL